MLGKEGRGIRREGGREEGRNGRKGAVATPGFFFLGGLGPFPLPSLSSFPSLSPPLLFPSLPLISPFLPSLSSSPSLPFPPLKTRRQTGRAPLPFSPLPSPPVPSFSLPLEVGPLKSSYGVWGSAVSSPSGVWGGAPAEIDFGAF